MLRKILRGRYMEEPAGHRIDYQQFVFTIEPEEPLILPSYKGSTLRGGFGYAFKRIACAIRNKECLDCILKERCVYSYIFETAPPSDSKIMRKYKTAPHPFVIEPPIEKRRGYMPGDHVHFGLTLIGRAIGFLPYFIYAFDELGKIGIGKGKTKYTLKSVSCGEKAIYESDTKTLHSSGILTLTFLHSASFTHDSAAKEKKSVRLSFITPTRLLYDGRLSIDLEFHILIRQLIRRIALLYYFHCGGDTSEVDFKGIIEKSQEVKVKSRNLHWYDWQRYSGRQNISIKMGGFVGDIVFEGDLEPFMQLIKAGAALHVGKGTAFGLGKYEIVKDANE